MASRVFVLTMIRAGKYPANIETATTRINLSNAEVRSTARIMLANGVSSGWSAVNGFMTKKISSIPITEPTTT